MPKKTSEVAHFLGFSIFWSDRYKTKGMYILLSTKSMDHPGWTGSVDSGLRPQGRNRTISIGTKFLQVLLNFSALGIYVCQSHACGIANVFVRVLSTAWLIWNVDLFVVVHPLSNWDVICGRPPGWYISLTPVHGTPHQMDYRNGLPEWMANMDYLNGLP